MLALNFDCNASHRQSHIFYHIYLSSSAVSRESRVETKGEFALCISQCCDLCNVYYINSMSPGRTSCLRPIECGIFHTM